MSSTPHTIRLRGPWEYRVFQALADTDPDQGRIDISNLNQLAPGVSNIELIRRFHKPTGLDDKHRVELVIGPRATGIAIDLNNKPLAVVESVLELRYDITARLELNNVLRIVIDVAKQQDIKLDEVRLEIYIIPA